MNRDLTVGRPETVLRQFCLPLFGSVVFQQLYNLADSLAAGKFIGETALAAVGSSYEVTLIFIAFAFGCGMGCSVTVSRFFGARDYGGVKAAVSTACLAGGVLCALLMAAGILGCGWLLQAIRTPAEAMADSQLYLDIYIWSLPFVFFYNLASGVFSALGDSRTPFLFLAASSTSNIAADILFVTAFDMGVAGIAWATFLCQGVSCLLASAAVFRRLRALETPEKAPLFSPSILGKIAAVAVPTILQQSFISVGNLFIQGVINGFGTGVMAGYSAAVKLNNLVITSFTTLGSGVSNYTAQNVGAQKLARVRAGFRGGRKLVWLLSLPLSLLYFFAGRALLFLFLDAPSETALRTGVEFLRILAPFYFVVSAKLVADGVLRGAGRMAQFLTATFTDLILRAALSALLAQTALGAAGIWCSWPVGWSVAAALSLLFYRAGPWKNAPEKDASGEETKDRFAE